MKKTCNICKGELYIDILIEDVTYLYACHNPKCPNYGLLQIPEEEMYAKEELKNEFNRAIRKANNSTYIHRKKKRMI